MRIIVFDIDCLRPDHLGCYGYDRPTSPTIDGIAEQGICFDNHFCASSPCLPSRTAWSSGRFGVNNGVVSNVGAGARFHIDKTNYSGPKPENDMLVRVLRRTGLDTISFSNFADRHSAPWFMVGWSEFHTPNLKGGGETADEVNASLLRWLEHNATREDYLLHVNYWDAHRCYKMDPKWAEPLADHPVTVPWPDDESVRRHAREITGPFTATGQFRDGESPFPLMPDAVTDRAAFEHMITGYDAAIRYVDQHVREVLDALDRHGVLDDAVLVVTGDHGDAFGEHGIYSDHVCADQCIHHIPLVVRWPGATPAGAHCGDLMYNVDWSATLCEMLGAEVPAAWDGASFAPQLRGEPGLDRECVVWDHGLYTVQRAVRTKTHLMVKTFDAHGYPFKPVELYDIVNDPYQTTDLSEVEPDVVAECEAHLADWLVTQRLKHPEHRDPVDVILEERGL